jgi:hypothetical protein
MKPLCTLVLVLVACGATGCNESLGTTAPSGQITLVSQLSGAQNVPPAGSLESAAAGSLQVTLVPAGGGAYVASFTFSLSGFVKAGVQPSPLDNGSAIVAGYVHQGGAGAVGSPVVSLPISQAAPIVTPTGTVLLTVSNVAIPAPVATAILANPSGYYFNLYSALNQTGVVRGQLLKM